MITVASSAKVANLVGSDAVYGCAAAGVQLDRRHPHSHKYFVLEAAVSATIQHNFGKIS
jgi:hypothetical protein